MKICWFQQHFRIKYYIENLYLRWWSLSDFEIIAWSFPNQSKNFLLHAIPNNLFSIFSHSYFPFVRTKEKEKENLSPQWNFSYFFFFFFFICCTYSRFIPMDSGQVFSLFLVYSVCHPFFFFGISHFMKKKKN